MHSIKFLSILVVLVLVTGAVYSSSTFIAFGEKSHCYVSARNPADYICVSTNNGKVTAVFYCPDWKGQGGCIRVYSGAGPDGGPGIPSEVRDALDAAVAESQNTTKVPEGALNDSSLLMGEDDNQTASKTIVPTQDRFCVEGTGGSTGKTCIRCDPGLDFEVGCVDVLTGGPLDMGTKSESEESNDTAGGNDDSKLSEDFGGLEFGDNTTKPELQ
jgi:hypothetical protein